MVILKLKFQKPKPYEIERHGVFDWSFDVEVDEELPHGYKGFGGLVCRRGGLWEAKSWSADHFGIPSFSREEAIKNCLNGALVSLRKFKDEIKIRETKIQHRENVAKDLRIGLPEGVKVWVSNADKIDEPLRFHVEIRNLDSVGIYTFLALLRKS